MLEIEFMGWPFDGEPDSEECLGRTPRLTLSTGKKAKTTTMARRSRNDDESPNVMMDKLAMLPALTASATWLDQGAHVTQCYMISPSG